jgi:predicted LPLAT superfamily acyltransferase
VALYYFLFDRASRRSSRQWLERALDREVSWRDVYRHLWTFAQVTLDRIFFLRGKTSPFDVNRNGHHYLEELRVNKQPAVLLGAHLGSFEAMRTGAKEDQLDLNIVGHFDNAQMVNSLFDRLDPDMRARVIDVGKDPISSTLKVRERVESGELVALLGDRVGLNEKTVEIEFMGESARFPTGPFLLASMLHCPVYLVFGLYYEPNRYELFCEPFAESIELPRRDRQGALEEVVQRYARRLEFFARKAPYNWFNFFDFWHSEDA